MRKHKDFMSEPDYGYIDIESCFEPIFEPPLETLEEWRSWEDEPEPTLENTSVYVTEPDGIHIFTAAIPGFRYPSISPRQANPWTS